MALPSLFWHIPLLILLSNSLFTYSSSPSSPIHSLSKGSSISVDGKNNKLVSPNSRFTAGFYEVGTNAYCFSIWFTEQINGNHTVVWMANRDTPVNVKRSKLSLREDGNLVLQDADHSIVWSTETKSTNGSSLGLQLEDTGNLVLYQFNGVPSMLWQSFDHPTDTLLPDQLFTKDTQLISSRSAANFSSGFYRLYFENNNVLSLLYNGPEITSVYWPPVWPTPWEAKAKRFDYNNTRIAKLDSQGQFHSSDNWGFNVSDFGITSQRIMKLDYDGNIRVYSLVVDQKGTKKWEVTWQAVNRGCKIHGECGPNTLCTYSQETGRKCACIPGYKKKMNQTDWAYGCEPKFTPCKQGSEDYIALRQAEFYGSDISYLENRTLEACKQICLEHCICKGFIYRYFADKGHYACYLKNLLYNGYQPSFRDSMYIKLPKHLVSSFQQRSIIKGSSYNCPKHQIMPIHVVNHNEASFKVLLLVVFIIGFFEILLIFIFYYITRKDSTATAGSYFPTTLGFKRFTYAELKTATRNFSEEIGRGGAGVVYKGKLSDDRVAAIKMLKEVDIHHGEAEFQAEISTIGRLNHMNLIETWGYCIEGKHRLVVYEYMDNGSLATSLISSKLDWGRKLEIAIGIAQGLAYLHEECMEWVLHCDVKPHNILLDANYNPKVADFGLSKLFDRAAIKHLSFSRIRGTRGYIAPEWALNLPINAKVDVYSYGVVILEMITGRSPLQMLQLGVDSSATEKTLVEWVREKTCEHIGSQNETWIMEIVDDETPGEYDTRRLKNLLKVGLRCVEEDRHARPSMSQVVNMLLHPRSHDECNKVSIP